MELSDCSWSMRIAEIQATLYIFVWHKSLLSGTPPLPISWEGHWMSGSQSSGKPSPVHCFGNMLRHKGSS